MWLWEGAVKYPYQVKIRRYQTLPRPLRFTIGDVIRCPAFRWGMKKNWRYRAPSERAVTVALRDPESCIRCKHRQDEIVEAHDESRASALFLVTAITLQEITGPEDIGAPPRLSKSVQCVRLTADGWLKEDAERVSFHEDPESLARPEPDEIEVVGYASLPIWGPGAAEWKVESEADATQPPSGPRLSIGAPRTGAILPEGER
jgi:hypothetical protein